MAACAALLYGAAYGPIVEAGKPAPPPPPPPPLGTEVYEWRPELGGWLDTSRNLIWGYSPIAMINGGWCGFDGTVAWTTTYPTVLTNLGFAAEGAVAAQYTNWRLPTLAECQDAYAKGFFAYGPGEFNWDTSPAEGAQGLGYDGRISWTSTLGTKKDSKLVWVFDPSNGSAGLVGKGSCIDHLAVVRTHVP